MPQPDGQPQLTTMKLQKFHGLVEIAKDSSCLFDVTRDQVSIRKIANYRIGGRIMVSDSDGEAYPDRQCALASGEEAQCRPPYQTGPNSPMSTASPPANNTTQARRGNLVVPELQAEQIGGRLYLLNQPKCLNITYLDLIDLLNQPKCLNITYLDLIERRIRQRANDHRRTIEIFIEVAQDRTLHAWVTFKKPVLYRDAKRRAKKFFERHLAKLAEGFIRVFELQENGRPHWHWIIRLLWDARACGAKAIRMAIQWHGAAYGFGIIRCDGEIFCLPKAT